MIASESERERTTDGLLFQAGPDVVVEGPRMEVCGGRQAGRETDADLPAAQPPHLNHQLYPKCERAAIFNIFSETDTMLSSH